MPAAAAIGPAHGALDPGERILDFVRKLANHQPVAIQLRQQGCFPVDALLPRGIRNFEQDLVRLKRRRNAVDRVVTVVAQHWLKFQLS